MKRILLLVAVPGFEFYNPHSAVGRYLLCLKEEFERYGMAVVLSTLETEPKADRQASTFGLPPSGRMGFFKKVVKSISPYIYYSLVNRTHFHQIEAMKQQLLALEFDHIIEYLCYGSDVGAFLKARKKATLTVIYDGPLNTQFYEMHQTYSFYKEAVNLRERESVEHADQLIYYSTPVYEHLKARYILPNTHQKLPCFIWEPTSVRHFNRLDDGLFHIGFIGSFLVWHKVELLVEALEILEARYPQLRLILIGYGAEWHRIKLLIERKGLSEKVHLPGFLDGDEKEVLKQKMDVAVMPGSNWYGSPLKLFEYAFAGIPIVAPSSPTVLDLFTHGKEVLFIDPDDELNSLIQHLENLVNNGKMRAALVAQASKHMNTFYSKDRYVTAYIDFFTSNDN